MLRAAALAAALAAGACSLTAPSPIPLAGPAPYTVLVLPPFGPAAADAGPGLLPTLPEALRARGYYPIPIEIGLAMLAQRDVDPAISRPAAAWAAIARDLGADAFLTLRVEVFDAVYAPHLQRLRYDIGYQLWDAAGGALLWELRSRDEGTWDPGAPALDPESSRVGYFTPIPVGVPLSPYEDSFETARAIHTRALALLPRGPLR